MDRIACTAVLSLLLTGVSCAAHADAYALAVTVHVDQPGLVHLVNTSTYCKVIGELRTFPSAGGGAAAYRVFARREVCPDGVAKKLQLQGALIPSIEGRVMAGTMVELVPIK